MQYNNLAEKAIESGISRTGSMRSELALIRAIQASRGDDACFRSDKRLGCGDLDCEWRSECCRLVAIWRR